MNAWLDKDFVIQIHELQLSSHGGMPGLRDESYDDLVAFVRANC
jgi:hypothetical protein